jgi:hypothetical protein
MYLLVYEAVLAWPGLACAVAAEPCMTAEHFEALSLLE